MVTSPDMSSPAVASNASAELAASGTDALSEMRANTYRFLAALLSAPPSRELLALLEQIDGDQSPGADEASSLAQAWQMLRLAGRDAEVATLDDEYHDLFIGIGRGELVPYASWYLTGFLMDRPLSYLRQDLRYLGIERQEGVHEPEDHVAALCEAMHEVIRAGDEISAQWQRKFFADHIAPWMGMFFRDLQAAKCACFYIAVGRLGEAFLELETRYLELRN